MGMAQEFADLRRRLSEIERRIGSQGRTGVVIDVDAAKGVARVQLTGGDTPFLTGWIPWGEPAAGANKTHNPPTAGQQVRLVSESGDLHDAVIEGSLNSDANGRPSSAGDAQVLLSIGSASITATGGGAAIVFKVGGYSLTLSASGANNTGGKVTHNATDIGDTHLHKDVRAGSSLSGPPK